MKNISDKSCRETQNMRFMFNFLFFSVFKNHADYEIMWKNVVEWDRP